MSLTSLVEFAQEHFGEFSRRSRDRGRPRVNQDGAEVARPPRPPVPTLIGQADDRTEALEGGDGFRIEGRVQPPPKPPDVDTFGADALAFWVPFHFYRERWGIYIRLSGVVYLATVLKGEDLVPGDEPY